MLVYKRGRKAVELRGFMFKPLLIIKKIKDVKGQNRLTQTCISLL